jgi:tetratricopeptide (TPR) repeat protein
MDAFIRHKHIGGLNAYRKPIVAAITIALLIGIFVGNVQHVCAAIPNEPVKISATSSTETEELSKRINQLVKELEYSDKVAEDFNDMVISWKDAQGEPVLVAWKQGLNQARQDYKKAKISKPQLAKLEENIVKELSQRIQKEITADFSLKFFDLADVIKHKQAQCLGYSQLLYITGNSVGLSVQAIEVVELTTGLLLPEAGHIASIVTLTDGRTRMVDLAPNGFISKPFLMEEEFAKAGNYWELKDKTNALGIHRRIQILDANGLIGSIYTNRGAFYAKLGQHTQAISHFTKAIELNPKYAKAYSNRGAAYTKLGQHTQAISDYSHAIELDPKFAQAYYNRGVAYVKLGQLPQAISDYTKAIELNPKYADAYCNRGVTYRKLGQLPQAMSDYTKAIELNPKDAEAYYNRGVAYVKLGQLPQAISDYNKAIELNPKYAEAYSNRGVVYGMLGQFTQAISDYNKAIELNPKYADAYINRGNAYYKLDQHTPAISDYAKAIELNPKYAKAYCSRGVAYAFLGKPEEAKKDLLKAVELNSALKALVKRISDHFKLDLRLD